jgi:hypothetical protein
VLHGRAASECLYCVYSHVRLPISVHPLYGVAEFVHAGESQPPGHSGHASGLEPIEAWPARVEPESHLHDMTCFQDLRTGLAQQLIAPVVVLCNCDRQGLDCSRLWLCANPMSIVK